MNKRNLSVASALGLILIGAQARADTTLTTKVTVTGATQSNAVVPAAGTYTTYSHGDMARTDLPNGQSWIFDFTNDQVATLDANKKTYSIQPLATFLAGPNAATTTASSYETSLIADSTKSAQTVAGQSVTGYAFRYEPAVHANAQRFNGSFGSPAMFRRRDSSSALAGVALPWRPSFVATSSLTMTGTILMTTTSSSSKPLEYSIPQLSIAFEGNFALSSFSRKVGGPQWSPIVHHVHTRNVVCRFKRQISDENTVLCNSSFVGNRRHKPLLHSHQLLSGEPGLRR